MKSSLLPRIHIDKKKGLIGFGLGLLSLCVIYLLRNTHISGTTNGPSQGYLLGFPIAFLFTLVGLIRIESRNSILTALLHICWYLASALAALLGTMAAVDCLSVWRMVPHTIFLNVMLFSAFVGVVYTFTGRLKLSVTIISLLELLIAYINSFVWQFRGREILFADLSAVGTALKVASGYSPVFSLKMSIGLSVWLLVLFSQFSIPADVPKKSLKARLAAFAAAVVLLVFSVFGSEGLPIQTYSNCGSAWNGFYINFIISIRDATIRPPENYSPEAVEEIAKEYSVSGQASDDYPNIIVIMNESFADFRVFNDTFQTNQPVTPFLDSLQENTIRGNALVSVYGGHTANSEFEFLTGLSMGFLPVGTFPYQQYISGNTFSLPWLLETHGYSCIATHPFYESSWGRKTTYPHLGFQSSTFLPDYPEENLVRKYVSDQEMYEYILQKLDEAPGNQPRFIFGITMQNHGGYRYEGNNYTKTIELEGCSREYPCAEQYLSLLHESDKALQYLLTTLEEYEENTVVLFFGDHLPGVESDLYSELLGSSLDTLDEQVLQYKVPFLIWANYDIEEQTVEQTTLGNLGHYLLDAAGIELPEFYQFLVEFEQHIPTINHLGYFSLSNNCFLTREEAQGEEKEWLDKYAAIQYNALFDAKNRSDIFFNQYLPSQP